MQAALLCHGFVPSMMGLMIKVISLPSLKCSPQGCLCSEHGDKDASKHATQSEVSLCQTCSTQHH